MKRNPIKTVVILVAITLALFILMNYNSKTKSISSDRSELSEIGSNNNIERHHPNIADAKTDLRQNLNEQHFLSKKWFSAEMRPNLLAGGIEVKIGFETLVSNELRKAIIYDLNLIYGHLTSHEFLDARGSEGLMVDGKLQHADRFLKFTGKGRFFPKVLTGKIGFMLGEQIIVPTEVIDNYKEALELKSQNESQYTLLLTTLETLNSLAERPIPNPETWFFLDPNNTTNSIEILSISEQEFADSYGAYRYLQPSLLNITKITDPESNLSGALLAKIYILKSDGTLSDSFPPMIFMDRSWKIFIQSPPT